MGYSTDFYGEFELDRPLEDQHLNYLVKFNETRRMKRNGLVMLQLPDPIRDAVGLPIGNEGEYFVGATGHAGQDQDISVLNYNSPPATQPGLWCGWVPNEDGQYIQWDGGEKFYEYVEWLRYLIHHFLERWGYVLNGTVEWSGEERDDMGRIVVEDNVVTVQIARITYEED